MRPTAASTGTRIGTNSLSDHSGDPKGASADGSSFADHFIAKLGLELSYDGTTCRGTASVRPESFAPGTGRIRTGYLATLVDVVAGHTPNGAVGPTIDLRVQVLSAPAMAGAIRLVCRPLRVGSRLIVAETMLYGDEDPTPFARATTTYMNVALGVDLPAPPRSAQIMDETSFDEFLGARIRDATSMELQSVARLANGMQGTVQGGVQAIFAEIAAEHAVGGGRRMVATDLDIRYLARLRAGPLVASVDKLLAEDGQCRAVVTLCDGADDRIVGRVGLTLVVA
jgi:acyl-coenzyme A thioesterase PaaI-like protein